MFVPYRRQRSEELAENGPVERHVGWSEQQSDGEYDESCGACLYSDDFSSSWALVDEVADEEGADGIDPSTRNGRLKLNLIAKFSEYEHGLIQEPVQADVNAARASNVKFCKPIP
ncbi:hypothetical protein CIK76_13090 [Glutamicibacter sp. BW80]|nr:hypothetical protein CIK76_13090 [Glutamicibacter sp. BW80]